MRCNAVRACVSRCMCQSDPIGRRSDQVAYQIVPLIFMLSLGCAIGTTTRVGHLLAEGQPVMARTATPRDAASAFIRMGTTS